MGSSINHCPDTVSVTDVLLIHPSYHRRAGSGIIPPLGLAYIAASLETQGFSVAILDCALDCGSQSPSGLKAFQQYLDRKLSQIAPRYCVGVGPTTTPALKSIDVLAQSLQRHYPQLPIIYGGPFASMPSQAPIFFNRLGATALIRGEGEQAFPALVNALQQGKRGESLPGVAWDATEQPAAALVAEINQLPFPARHLLENQRYRPSLRRNIFDGPMTPIYWSRGCPYQCNFCVSPMLRGRRISRRSLANLFAEMRQCVEQFDIRGFIFYDDCLFLKSERLNQEVQAFCQELTAQVGPIQWEMELRCDAIATLSPKSVEALYGAGCRQINMGIEKASDRQLKTLEKHLVIEDVVAACSQVKAVVPAMRLAGTFILGGPDETEAEIETLVGFAQSLELDFAHFYPLSVYPGTPFFDTLFGDDASPTAWADRLLADEGNYWGEILYETDALPAWRLLELVHWAYNTFYQRRQWLERLVTTTSPAVRQNAQSVVDRWCQDRFHLSLEEVVR